MEQKQIPSGSWQDAKGCLIPESMIKPIDRERDRLVCELADDEQSKMIRGLWLEVADRGVVQNRSEEALDFRKAHDARRRARMAQFGPGIPCN
ncbi:Mu gp16 gemA [Burkholderia aenigmatica]|uniref:Mu gp16 gemA n=1 Tax=Burkholderia aenigmatica TaxID=2015348 RepID=A0ABY6XWV7_9BURK|nr:DUF3164 family protein [Burkholderia aenigmatica]VWC71908.1 Mu gp16 gemA [Burkholderia aenigmatica]VWD27948.1 Mu gp16 gemA [Burkholderia aenigmatica]